MTGVEPDTRSGAGRRSEQLEQPRRRRVRRLSAMWLTTTVGAVMWVLLWGDLSWANVLAGVALSALVALAFPLPPVGATVTLRPVPLARFVGRFVSDLVVASFQVAWIAVRPGATPRGGLVPVELRSTSDLFVVITAGLSSMVPGILVVDLDRSSSTLRLHVLDLAGAGGPDGVRASTLAMEERLLRAFATRAELAGLGLAGTDDGPVPRGGPTSRKEGRT